MKTLKTIALLSITPLLLTAWYYTRATQFLFIIGLVELLAIAVNILGAIGILISAPLADEKERVKILALLKDAVNSKFRYIGPITGALKASVCLYFEHYALFIILCVGMVSAFATLCTFKVIIDYENKEQEDFIASLKTRNISEE